MKYDLSYDDQCDLLRGRLVRLYHTDNKILTMTQEQQKRAGLDIKDLGISGAQYDMVMEHLKHREKEGNI